MVSMATTKKSGLTTNLSGSGALVENSHSLFELWHTLVQDRQAKLVQKYLITRLLR